MKTISALLIALLTFGVGVTAFQTEADAGRRARRNAAIGVAAGIATLAIIAGSRRAHAEDYDADDDDYRPRRGLSCRQLRYRCEDGSEWACDKYEDRC